MSNELGELEHQRVGGVDEPVDRKEVWRYLGYPVGASPNSALAPIIDYWIDQAAEVAKPRAVYLVLPVLERQPRRIRLRTAQGTTDFQGAIGEFLGPVSCVAVFIATASAGIEALASELLRGGEELAALVVNAVGSERAEAAEAAVISQLRARAAARDFSPTLPYSPGYCGMKLTEQRKLFELFRGKTAGVRLTEDCLMRPIKSVSGLIGLGPAHEIAIHGSPCDRCELYTCAMRR